MEHRSAVDESTKLHRRLRAIAAFSVTALAVTGISLGVAFANRTGSDERANHHVVASVRSAGISAVTAPVPRVPCSDSAVVSPTSVDPKDEYRLSHFPPSEVPDEKSQPLSETQAVQLAQDNVGRGGGVDPTADRSKAPTTSVETSYGDLAKQSSNYMMLNSLISADRCVWIVTVQAPYSVKVPPGREPRTDSVYNVILDVGSGHEISVVSGVDLAK